MVRPDRKQGESALPQGAPPLLLEGGWTQGPGAGFLAGEACAALAQGLACRRVSMDCILLSSHLGASSLGGEPGQVSGAKVEPGAGAPT